MEQLKAKLKKQGGFTMVELLIVVAIIAILVAVSIPMMNQALEKSRHAVDQANIRDAIGLISVEYSVNPNAYEDEIAYYYCVDKETHQGYLSTEKDNAATAQCTCGGAPEENELLYVSIKAPTDTTKIESKPEIKVSWTFDKQTEKTTDTNKTPTAPKTTTTPTPGS